MNISENFQSSRPILIGLNIWNGLCRPEGAFYRSCNREQVRDICPRKNRVCVCERRDRLTKKRLEMEESPWNVDGKVAVVRLENRHFFTQIKILKKEFLPCKASCTVGKKICERFLARTYRLEHCKNILTYS